MQENQHLILRKARSREKTSRLCRHTPSRLWHRTRDSVVNKSLQLLILLDWTRRCTNRPEMSVFVHVSPLSSA